MHAFSEESDNSQDISNVTYEGWCLKQGSIFRTWKKRWLVLKGSSISYFASPDNKLKGIISLENSTVQFNNDSKKKSAFSITTPKRIYNLIANTEEEANSWVEAIMLANGQKKPKVGINDFEVLKVLGRGTCGKVQLVRHKQSRKLYALKSMSKAKLEEINLVNQILTEKDALLSINHPFIVSARYTFQTDTKVFLVLDYAAGGELLKHLESEYENSENLLMSEDDIKNASQLDSYSYSYNFDDDYESESESKSEKVVDNNSPNTTIKFKENIGINSCLPITQYDSNNYGGFPLNRVRIYAAEIAQAIKYMHSIGIIHRDLKPANILLDKDGHIKLTDFGLVKEKMFGKCAKTSTFCGTPLYAAPEIVQRKPYGRSVDWWSFGVIIYELIFYDSPFSSDNLKNLCKQIVEKNLQFPKKYAIEGQIYNENNQVNDDVNNKKLIPFVVYDFLTKLLAKDPMDRLGANNEDEIFNHPFFEGISMTDLLDKKIEIPWKPKLKNEYDVSFFYEEFTGEEALISIEDPSLVARETNEAFANFSFTNENNLMECL